MQQNIPEVYSFFDEATNAACYIVKDPDSNACAVIDSILDFDQAAGRTHTAHADMLITKIIENGWSLDWIIETHVHADHLSAAPYLAEKLGGKIAIGANIAAVQEVFGKIFIRQQAATHSAGKQRLLLKKPTTSMSGGASQR